MRTVTDITKGVLTSTTIMALIIGQVGCAMFDQDKYYLYNGSVYDRANVKPRDGTQVTDKDVLGFSNDVKTVLRQRMNWARIARLTSGTLQVFTAAAAAALGAASGSITAVAALAASSAVMPELQNIFEAKERAEAYNQGVALIEDAEVRYFASVSGTVNNQRLTPDGANFYFEVLASLKLVEKALVAQLPTIEELQKATGKFHQIEIAPSSLTILRTAPATFSAGEFVILSGGPVVNAVSSNPQVADVKKPVPADGKKVEIDGKSLGSTTITIVNASGGSRTALVTVTEVVDLELAGPSAISVNKGETKSYKFTITNNTTSSVANHVTFTAALSAGMKVETVQGTGWTCQIKAGDSVACSGVPLSKGSAAPIDLKLTAPSEAGEFTGTANVTASEPDSDPSNNIVTFKTTVN